ncbi:MAG TPA: TRCF domain-containing protein, partial [Dehalococcoidia bacterium]|nr:TRCF domain-containing protein [Dehalococcoidia bacterium]
ELQRGGQVYFVHNRIQTIGRVARELAELVPEARIAVAHGRMAEEKLAEAVERFSQRQIDVLVCTTIIEAGLDMPHVNTIIIDQAHKLGLAQLYQLRGRVGRRGVQAYAYLVYDKRARLTDAARRRLQAIFEASELGSGMQIAMRDLEIRGAGNLLGAEQSGHIGAVGFDLYCRLLGEAVAELKARQAGEELPKAVRPSEVSIDLPLSAHLPREYVADDGQRLALYRRLAAAATLEDVEEMAEEMRDRFGPPPEPAQALLYVLRLRALAGRAQVRTITTEDRQIVLRSAPGRWLETRGLPRPLPPGVRVGTSQVRLALGEGWQEALLKVLEGLAAHDYPPRH